MSKMSVHFVFGAWLFHENTRIMLEAILSELYLADGARVDAKEVFHGR